MSEMRTPEEWLALGDKLEIELGKMLTPGPWKHSLGRRGSICNRCHNPKFGRINGKKTLLHCTVPDPITIDWNTAKLIQGRFSAEKFDLSFSKVIIAAFRGNTVNQYTHYAIHRASARHYLIAAAMTAERSKK